MLNFWTVGKACKAIFWPTSVKRETFHNSGFSTEGTFISAVPSTGGRVGGHISASSLTDKNCTKGKSKVQRWRSNMEQRTLMEAKNQWRWPSVQRGENRQISPLWKIKWESYAPLVWRWLDCRTQSCLPVPHWLSFSQLQASKQNKNAISNNDNKKNWYFYSAYIYIPGSSMPRADITHIVYWARDCYQFKK